jgi:hypothetical protein
LETGNASPVGRAQAHTVEQVRVAMATNEHVAASLRRFPGRDHAIEKLEADVASQRRDLIRELHAVARAHSAAPVAARMSRDAFLRPVRSDGL